MALETEAFSRREIGGEDDVLNFFVGHFVDVDLTRQPASQSAIGVFDFALLPRRVGVTEPSGHGASGLKESVLGEGGVIVESNGLAQRGFDYSALDPVLDVLKAAESATTLTTINSEVPPK